jgi:ligand-binding sensor domain-containing protein
MKKTRRSQRMAYITLTKRFIGSVLLFLSFVISNSHSIAQNPQWMVFDTLNSPLPGNNVEVVFIDDSGNKWLVTTVIGPYTLTKYNGIQWLIYDHNSTGIFFSSIMSIAAENQNTLWFPVVGLGIVRLKNGVFSVFDYPNIPLPLYNYVFEVDIDPNGVKWFATEHGLLSYNDSTWVLYNQSNSGLPTNRIFNISIDAQGNKWIGTDSGFVKYDDSVWVVYDLSNSFWNPGNTFLSMATDPSGVKWFATYDGLFRYDDTTWTVYNETNTPLIENNYRSIAFDHDGILWLGTGGSGLWKYDGLSWTRYYHFNSGLPQNTVLSIAIDNNNNKWIGTREGLAVFNETGVVLSAENQISVRESLMAYPNPADQYVIIRSSGSKPVTMDQIEVFSITGVKQSLTFKPVGQNEWTLVTSILPNGIYLARVTLSNREQATVRFIIRR